MQPSRSMGKDRDFVLGLVSGNNSYWGVWFAAAKNNFKTCYR